MSRSDALAAYEKLPLPDTTEEHWRFTDLRGFNLKLDSNNNCGCNLQLDRTEQLLFYITKSYYSGGNNFS